MSKLWRRVALLAGIVCFGSCLFSCGLGYGLLYRTEQTYQEQYLKERELIEPLLASDPAFAGLECSRRSAGGVDLVGVVPAQSDRERLSERIIRLVGEPVPAS